jgi:drug/metabolite transporter (DMT)-like permease
LSEPHRGKPFQVTRTGEKIFGVLAIVVGLGLAILAGGEANIPSLVLVLLTVGVLGWVAYYFVVVRPAVTGLRRSRRGADRETG